MNNQDHQQTADSSKLPSVLRKFFWDYDFETLSWENSRDMIIGRILTYGSWGAVTWLRSHAGDRALREWIERHRGGRMSPQRLRFWELILELPHREVTAWIQAQERRISDNRVKPPGQGRRKANRPGSELTSVKIRVRKGK